MIACNKWLVERALQKNSNDYSCHQIDFIFDEDSLDALDDTYAIVFHVLDSLSEDC